MSKEKRMIITDNLDLSERKIITKDEFYQDKKNSSKINISDFLTVDSGKIEKNKEMLYYALVSTSDKEINCRSYDYKSWEKTVVDKMWISPYQKPILYNHDLYNSSPQGRIQNTFFINHSDKKVICSSLEEELPQDVINFYDSLGAFNEGTASIIARISPDNVLAQRIESGLDITVSQSSYMDKAVCSICGKNYYGDECSHIPGKTYKLEDGSEKTCIVKTFDYEPIELSFVTIPANKTSIVYSFQKKQSSSNDNLAENNIQIKDDENEDNKNIKNGENKDMELKNILKDMISQKLNLGEELKDSYDKLFDSMTPEQINYFKNIIDHLTKKAEVVENHSDNEKNNTEESLNNEGENLNSQNNVNEDNENNLNEVNKDNKDADLENKPCTQKENKFKDNENVENFYKDSNVENKPKYDNETQALINACLI